MVLVCTWHGCRMQLPQHVTIFFLSVKRKELHAQVQIPREEQCYNVTRLGVSALTLLNTLSYISPDILEITSVRFHRFTDSYLLILPCTDAWMHPMLFAQGFYLISCMFLLTWLYHLISMLSAAHVSFPVICCPVWWMDHAIWTIYWWCRECLRSNTTSPWFVPLVLSQVLNWSICWGLLTSLFFFSLCLVIVYSWNDFRFLSKKKDALINNFFVPQMLSCTFVKTAMLKVAWYFSF